MTAVLLAAAVIGTSVPVQASAENQGDTLKIYEAAYDMGSYDGNVYEVISAVDPSYKVNVYNTRDDDGTNIHLWEANGCQAQKFMFIYDGDGYYHILNVHSWKAVDVKDGNSNPGANIQQWSYNGSDAQKWAIIENSDGTVTFKNKLGTVMDAAGGKAENGTNIQAYAENGTKAQKWTLMRVRLSLAQASFAVPESLAAYTGAALTPDTELKFNSHALTRDTDYTVSYADNVEPGTAAVTVTGKGSYYGTLNQTFVIYETVDGLASRGTYYMIPKTDSSLAVDSVGEGIVKGTRVCLSGQNRSEAQIFTLAQNADGTFEFISEKSELSFDVAGNSQENGAAVQLYDSNHTDAQKWMFHKNEDGSYSVLNKASGKALDLENSKAVSGSCLVMNDANGSDSQKFLFAAAKTENKAYDGVWTMTSALKSSAAADVPNASAAADVTLQMWGANGSPAQQFRFLYSGGGYYRIMNVNSGKALTDVEIASVEKFMDQIKAVYQMAHDGNYRYGNSMATPPCSDGIISCDRLIARALWNLGYTDQNPGGMTVDNESDYLSTHGFYAVTDMSALRHGDVVLYGVEGEDPNVVTHTAIIDSYDASTGIAQRYDGGGDPESPNTAQIQPLTDQLNYWTHRFIVGYRMAEVRPLRQEDYTGSDSQLFRVSDNGDGTVSLISKRGEAIQVSGSSASAGTKLEMAYPDGNAGQKWILTAKN
jgi:hypothetical protein